MGNNGEEYQSTRMPPSVVSSAQNKITSRDEQPIFMVSQRSQFVEAYPNPTIDLDNGIAKAKVDIHTVYNELSQLASPEAAKSVVAWIQRFAKDIERAKTEGMHLGSSNLQFAIGSSFYDRPGHVMDPKRFNLQTEIELKLAAKLVEGMVELTS